MSKVKSSKAGKKRAVALTKMYPNGEGAKKSQKDFRVVIEAHPEACASVKDENLAKFPKRGNGLFSFKTAVKADALHVKLDKGFEFESVK